MKGFLSYKMVRNSLTIKLEETRLGLCRIRLTTPYDRKIGITNINPQIHTFTNSPLL